MSANETLKRPKTAASSSIQFRAIRWITSGCLRRDNHFLQSTAKIVLTRCIVQDPWNRTPLLHLLLDTSLAPKLILILRTGNRDVGLFCGGFNNLRLVLLKVSHHLSFINSFEALPAWLAFKFRVTWVNGTSFRWMIRRLDVKPSIRSHRESCSLGSEVNKPPRKIFFPSNETEILNRKLVRCIKETN